MSINDRKLLFNYHTHTYRCGHASGSDEDYVKAALEGRYKVLGFSDHAPYKNYSHKGIHMEWNELDGYIKSINDLKEKYKNQIEIKLGLETEFIPSLIEEKRELRSKVDYLILGQHFDSPAGKGFNAFYENDEDEILRYAHVVCEGLDSGLFTYLAHPDVILTNQEEFSDAIIVAANMIGKKVSEKKIPVEINIQGSYRDKHLLNNRQEYYYPNHSFWKILSAYDIKVVVGIDAHNPYQLTEYERINKVLNELEDLNLDIIKEPFI